MLTLSHNREPLRRGAAALTLIGMLAVAAPLAALTLSQRADPRPVVRAEKADVVLTPRPVQPAPRPVTTPPAAKPVVRVSPVVVAPVGDQQAAPGSVSGVARDASGGVLPGVQLTLTDSANQSSIRVTDGAGTFRFPDLRPGAYNLTAVLPGFQSLRMEFSLEAGQNLERGLTLRVGSLQETITVVCAPGGARLTPGTPASRLVLDLVTAAKRLFLPVTLSAQAKPVRVGGNILTPKQINKVNPICPSAIQPPATGTVVILEATIGTDGFVKDVKPLRDPIPEFTESAAQAVRQWQYTPTRLNNVPVPVIMTVTVFFTNK